MDITCDRWKLLDLLVLPVLATRFETSTAKCYACKSIQFIGWWHSSPISDLHSSADCWAVSLGGSIGVSRVTVIIIVTCNLCHQKIRNIIHNLRSLGNLLQILKNRVLWGRPCWKSTSVTEDRVSIFRIEEQAKKETFTKLCLLPTSCWVLGCFTFHSWRWRRHGPPKRRLTFSGLCGVIYTENRTLRKHRRENLQTYGI
jgi:hypothetical protein